MPETIETKKIHLLDDLFGGPLLKRDAIGGHEDAGAVLAESAMNENFLCRVIAEQGEKLNHLFICRRGPFIDGNMNEAHSQGLDFLAFPDDFSGIFLAKVNDRGDAEFLEFGQTLRSRLRAAVETIIDSAAVGDGRYAKFFSVCRMHTRRGPRRRIPLRRKDPREGEEANQTEK